MAAISINEASKQKQIARSCFPDENVEKTFDMFIRGCGL